MSQFFGPNPVSVRDIPIWLREAGGLFARRPATFIGLSATYHFLADSARALAPFGFLFAVLLANVFLSISIVASEAADHSRRVPISPTFRMIRNILWVELLLSVLFLAWFVVSYAVGSYLVDAVSLPKSDATPIPPFLQWTWRGFLAFFTLWVGLMWTWFVPPLIALHDLPFRTAWRLSQTAEDMNTLVVWLASAGPLLVVIVVLQVAPLASALSIVLAPLLAAYQYVMYRDVFLGRRRNREVVVQTAAAQAAEHVAPTT